MGNIILYPEAQNEIVQNYSAQQETPDSEQFVHQKYITKSQKWRKPYYIDKVN